MNVRKHLTIGLTLVGLALGLTTVPANAQSTILKGTFDLPEAAYWGNTLLPPGQYNISMRTSAGDLQRVPAVHVSGEGISTTFLAVPMPVKPSGRDSLDIDNIDGTYVIRAFEVGPIGQSFAFGVTKSVKNKALRASAEPAMAVPVTSGAGF